MAGQYDNLPPNTDGAEEIALCAINQGHRSASLTLSGAFAASGDPRRMMQAAEAFMFHAASQARHLFQQFGQTFTTMDVVQAAGILADYYREQAAEIMVHEAEAAAAKYDMLWRPQRLWGKQEP